MTQTFTKDVHSTQEYKDAIKHAGALGFGAVEMEAFGGWESAAGDPVFLHRGGNRRVEKVGRKYFHVEVDGEVVRVTPVETFSRDAGFFRITFKERG